MAAKKSLKMVIKANDANSQKSNKMTMREWKYYEYDK